VTKEYRVYKKCDYGHRQGLEVEFTGSYRQCQSHLQYKERVWHRPTHYNFISSLDVEAAERRYLKGP
jgi:hypothetical protein